ncbi:MAG: hypothetical protein V2I67_08445 [Thermoanaerobaculales bacterium]|jgi:hypothetical protein|nr:hypothetical protein [Thermoanaerobaculales bacterium]
MSTQERVFLAVVLVLIDLTLFALPLTGLFAAYVLLARPPWFLTWLERLYNA